MKMHTYTVEPLYIESGSDIIACDYYRPLNIRKPAIIIMAHGFAGLRHFRLIPFAQKFAQAGYAVILFDYRCWGGSTGQPREMVSVDFQLDDWNKVITYVAQQRDIDIHHIVLWGTGLSGGYVLKLAAERRNIFAIISQVPFLDGTESVKRFPIQQLSKALKLSSQDYMRSKIGLTPITFPVVHPYALSYYPSKDGYQGFMSIVNSDYYWSGEVPARAFFQLARFRPIQYCNDLNKPVLLIAAKKDQLTLIQLGRELATNMATNTDYIEWDMSHFEIYHEPWLQKAISAQLKFLERYIGVS